MAQITFRAADQMSKSKLTKLEYQFNLSNRMFPLLTNVLNEVHGKKFSERFCRILLEDHVRAIISFEKELTTEAPGVKADQLSLNNSFVASGKERFRRKIVQLAKHLLSGKNRAKRDEIMRKNQNISLGFSSFSEQHEIPSLKELPDYHPVFMRKGDSSKRKVLYEIADRFQDHFTRNSIRLLPGYVIEHFEKEYEKIDVIDPDQKSFHVLQLRFTEFDSLFVAKYVEHGSKLYWYQDGQEMAELAYKYARHIQYSVADQYKTWGWKQKEMDTPWKSYPLLKFRTKYENIQNSGKYDLMLCYPLLNTENRAFNEKNTEELLQNLNREKNFNILARPYPVSRKQSNEGQLHFIKDKRVTVSTGLTPMVKEMSECRLIIQMEIPSTNFMECIFVNHPGTGLIVNDQPTEMIKPYYDAFSELGIFHYTIDSMVQFLNQTDIDEWWESMITHEKMKEFKSTFASESIPVD